MSTVYTGVDCEESGTDYDNPVDAPALYELAVAENPNYSSLHQHRPKAEMYPVPREFEPTPVEYDLPSGSSPQPIYDDRTRPDADYLQTSGLDDNAIAQQVLLQGDQPTYHYVEPSALTENEAKVPTKWWKRPWFIGSLILLVAMGIGATALVLVATGRDQVANPNTGASTGEPVKAVPSGIVAPFLREACPDGWTRLQGQFVSAPTFEYAESFRAGSGATIPNLETKRLFIRPSNDKDVPGTLEEDATKVDGLYVNQVSAWGNTEKRITYVTENDEAGLLFLDMTMRPVEGGAPETRPKSISLLYCVKI